MGLYGNYRRSKRLLHVILDAGGVVLALWASLLFKPATLAEYLEANAASFVVFLGIWIFFAWVFRKYSPDHSNYHSIIKRIVLCGFASLVLATLLMYGLRYLHLSRLVVFLTVALATTWNLMVYSLWYLVRQSKEIADDLGEVFAVVPSAPPAVAAQPAHTWREPAESARAITVRWAIESELGIQAHDFLRRNVDLFADTTLIVSTTTQFNIDSQPRNYFTHIVNLKRVNDIRWINKFFEAVNEKLPIHGLYVCRAETQDLRKLRIMSKYPLGINVAYYALDFVVKRLFPKFGITKGLYFFLTRGENRVISRSELLGRLYSCGFEVIDEQYLEGSLYVISRKVKLPAYDHEATYGMLVKLKRVGRGGKIIKVYKMRTMHPYAEYLQEYVYRTHNLKEGGKFKDDFRISTLGKIMRKLWIDELPMLINLVKGELKLVGVRPLSQQYFSLYSKELQERRIKVKPGLIPPFYADRPKTLNEIMESEMRYLEAYERSPVLTDLRYFVLAVYNILFRRYRSS